MSAEVPWETTDIYHDDPASFPLEDFLPLNALGAADWNKEEPILQDEPVPEFELKEGQP